MFTRLKGSNDRLRAQILVSICIVCSTSASGVRLVGDLQLKIGAPSLRSWLLLLESSSIVPRWRRGPQAVTHDPIGASFGCWPPSEESAALIDLLSPFSLHLPWKNQLKNGSQYSVPLPLVLVQSKTVSHGVIQQKITTANYVRIENILIIFQEVLTSVKTCVWRNSWLSAHTPQLRHCQSFLCQQTSLSHSGTLNTLLTYNSDLARSKKHLVTYTACARNEPALRNFVLEYYLTFSIVYTSNNACRYRNRCAT